VNGSCEPDVENVRNPSLNKIFTEAYSLVEQGRMSVRDFIPDS
jgi:hypothetical protein